MPESEARPELAATVAAGAAGHLCPGQGLWGWSDHGDASAGRGGAVAGGGEAVLALWTTTRQFDAAGRLAEVRPARRLFRASEAVWSEALFAATQHMSGAFAALAFFTGHFASLSQAASFGFKLCRQCVAGCKCCGLCR